MIGVANGTLPLDDVRYAGDLVPELALLLLRRVEKFLISTP